jgi:hypothetical protein
MLHSSQTLLLLLAKTTMRITAWGVCSKRGMRSRLLSAFLAAVLCRGLQYDGYGVLAMTLRPRSQTQTTSLCRPSSTPGSSVRAYGMFRHYGPARRRRLGTVARFSFFKDLLDRAFENDPSISQTDKRKGQLEAPGEAGDDDETASRARQLTETQQKWRQLVNQQSPSSVGPLSIAGTVVTMDLYLTGVPNKDPSNDLYGSRVNISSRDRRVNQALPAEPTVPSLQIAFRSDLTCQCLLETPFTSAGANSVGEWKLSVRAAVGNGGGRDVRFRIPVLGYTRTVETKGTIQKVYWSDGNDAVRATSTTYTIEPGWLYGEATVSSDRRGQLQWDSGVLKVEKTGGLLGAATTLVPCGAFAVTGVVSDEEESTGKQ